MSDDSTKNPTVSESELQDVSRPRNWRQRYCGPEGTYVFRASMSIRTPGGQSRRVERGEVVDAAAMGITPRRLKALWYSNNIELADPGAPRAGGRKLKKTVVDNEALRREEAELEAATLKAAREENELRKQVRAQLREEEKLRKLAEKAVKVAEERELAEMRELGLEDDREAFEALVKERLEDVKVKAEEKAKLDAELAKERAELDEIRSLEAEDQAQKDAEERAHAEAEREGESLKRAAAREAKRAERLEFNEPASEDGPPINPKTESMSADEAAELATKLNRSTK